MAVSINSNISALSAQRRLAESTSVLSSASEKLSSGLRINRSKDDAAGLQIAEGLRVDSNVYSQAIKNVNDGASLLDIAQGAVEQLSGIVIRQTELAEQAANGTYSYKQRKAMDAEANALVREYNRIVQTTSFNGIRTLTGVTNALHLQFGYGSTGGIDVGVGSKMGFAAGDGTFGTGGGIDSTFTTGTTPYEVITADVNGDGNLDLLNSDFGANSFSVQFGNGDGSFRARASYAVALNPVGITLDDFNGDGIGDIATPSFGASSVISISLGNSDGTYQLSRDYSGGGSKSYYVQSGDLNGDGIKDLVVSNDLLGTIGILTGNRDGSFSSPTVLTSSPRTEGVLIRDFNGDGAQDIVTSNWGAGAGIIFFAGNGDGTFLARRTVVTAAGSSFSYSDAADLNGDGIVDLVSSDEANGYVWISLGNGDGTFRAAGTYYSGSNPYKSMAVDVNGDSVKDIIAANAGSNTLSVFLGNGDGTYLSKTNYIVSNSPASFAFGDLNNDGAGDIVASQYYVNTVSTLLGHVDSSGRRNNLMEALDLTSQYRAKQALTSSKAALVRLGQELGSLGAIQSRLSSASQMLQSSRENFNAARSQLIDADVAQESAALLSAKILQRGSVAVLAQANQQPALALRLLGEINRL